MEITKQNEAYLEELAADIVANGGLEGKTIEEAFFEAHNRRQEFAREIAEGRTDRSKVVREHLCKRIYRTINAGGKPV